MCHTRTHVLPSSGVTAISEHRNRRSLPRLGLRPCDPFALKKPRHHSLPPRRRAGLTSSDERKLTGSHRHGVLRIVTDTCVRLWRRVHMDLVRYAGCVCRPSC
ncbi:putative leader peptide [Streptomyces canus]|uniref:putative leader peptide n=1 Tax=Streptomyces canus TaxID=58343 RepID=UPI003850BCC7